MRTFEAYFYEDEQADIAVREAFKSLLQLEDAVGKFPLKSLAELLPVQFGEHA